MPNLPPIAATRALTPEGQSILRFWEQLGRLDDRTTQLAKALTRLEPQFTALPGVASRTRALTAQAVRLSP